MLIAFAAGTRSFISPSRSRIPAHEPRGAIHWRKEPADWRSLHRVAVKVEVTVMVEGAPGRDPGPVMIADGLVLPQWELGL